MTALSCQVLSDDLLVSDVDSVPSNGPIGEHPAVSCPTQGRSPKAAAAHSAALIHHRARVPHCLCVRRTVNPRLSSDLRRVGPTSILGVSGWIANGIGSVRLRKIPKRKSCAQQPDKAGAGDSAVIGAKPPALQR